MEYSDYIWYTNSRVVVEPRTLEHIICESIGKSLGFTWLYIEGQYDYTKYNIWIDENLPQKWCWRVSYLDRLCSLNVQIRLPNSALDHANFELLNPEIFNNIKNWQKRIVNAFAKRYINSQNTECQNNWLNSGYIINGIIDFATIKIRETTMLEIVKQKINSQSIKSAY